MGNIVRWFEDFPRRALDLLPEMKGLAEHRDRVGSLALLIAPALIVAPYERLQTHVEADLANRIWLSSILRKRLNSGGERRPNLCQ